jgi:uncharacterized membrane protein
VDRTCHTARAHWSQAVSRGMTPSSSAAGIVSGIAYVHIATGPHDLAREQWAHALECLAGVAVGHTMDDDVTAEAVRVRLERLAGTGSHRR